MSTSQFGASRLAFFSGKTGRLYVSSLPLSSPRAPPLWLLEATAGSLLPLRLNVVVYLELGLVWLLCRSVLQLPGGDRERQEVTADAGGGGCVGCSTDWASELDKMRERGRKLQRIVSGISSECLRLESFSLLALKNPSDEDKASPK